MGTYDVREFGAVGDGIHKDTDAIQKAMDCCCREGGGQVVLTAGIYVAGTLYLRNNVCLTIDESATLAASGDVEDYGQDTHYNRYVNEHDMDRCFLYGEDVRHIGIQGRGVIDGRAELFSGEGGVTFPGMIRPMMIRLLRCQDVRIQGLRLSQAAAWTTAFLDSEDIWVEDLDICNDKRYNGDGLDFDGCRNVFVSRCKIRGTDDNLCLQAGSREYPVENIHISDCHFTSVCAGIRIGLKSMGDIRGVTVTGCTFQNVWREGIKIECTEGGNISDIVIQGIVMHNVRRPLFLLLNNRLADIGSSVGLTAMPPIGTMKRVQVSGLIAVDGEEMEQEQRRFGNDSMGNPRFGGIRVDANRNHPIENLVIQNLDYRAVGGVKCGEIPKEYPEVIEYHKIPGETDVMGSENYYPDWSRTSHMDIRNVKNLVLSQVLLSSVHADERPVYLLEGCRCLKEEVYIEEDGDSPGICHLPA